MAIDLNKYGNCTTDFTGTGLTTCDVSKLGDLVGFNLHKQGWNKTLASDDFDLAEWKLDVKGFNVLPLIGVRDFTQDTPEDEENTSSTGVLSLIRNGKPQFSFMFEKGTCFHKQLFQKTRGKWDYSLVFEKGIALAVNSDKTKIKAFNGGRLSVPTYKFQQGTDPEMSTAKIQLLDAVEFNERLQAFYYDQIGDLKEVTGVVETVITVDPIVAGSTFTASIVTACNSDNNILDLDAASTFVLLGTQASATTIGTPVYNATTNKYTFTTTPALVATDTVAIKLGNGTYDVVEDSLGTMYKGTSNTVTVS